MNKPILSHRKHLRKSKHPSGEVEGEETYLLPQPGLEHRAESRERVQGPPTCEENGGLAIQRKAWHLKPPLLSRIGRERVDQVSYWAAAGRAKGIGGVYFNDGFIGGEWLEEHPASLNDDGSHTPYQAADLCCTQPILCRVFSILRRVSPILRRVFNGPLYYIQHV
jgi:hypothetical protein